MAGSSVALIVQYSSLLTLKLGPFFNSHVIVHPPRPTKHCGLGKPLLYQQPKTPLINLLAPKIFY